MKKQWKKLKSILYTLITGKVRNDDTPLQRAVLLRDIETVKKLLDEGFDINEGGIYEMTPLRIAVSQGDTEMARLLLQRGASATGQGIQHALAYAETNGRLDMLWLFEEHGIKRDPSVTILS